MNKNSLYKKRSATQPLVSIITPSYNQGEFLDDCVQSIQKQTYKNVEHIVVDGVSNDDTLKKLKKYSHIKWISEKDNGYWDAITKGVRMAKGKYMLICMVSDGYKNKQWIEKCVAVLEKDSEVSMVWGFPIWLEGEKYTDMPYPHFHKGSVPQKFDWLPYWLMTGEALPNGNFCIHKKVFKACNAVTTKTPKGAELYILNYNFNTFGYLPYNIPEVAEFAREHPGQIGESWTKKGWLPRARKTYFKKIEKYKESLLSGKKKHIYRDSKGKIIDHEVNLQRITPFNAYYLRAKVLFYIVKQRGLKRLKKQLVSLGK